MDEQKNVEGSSWRCRARVARLLDGLGVAMDVTTIVVPVLADGSPAIAVTTTGLLALGLHSAAKRLRRR
nr:hypothetical protein GCM10017745_35760 [Saccharothrix mutabilis subsp. capreolus]